MIKDKVVLVTGGAQGIGKAIAAALLKNDVKAVVICDLKETLGLETVSELRKEFGSDRVEFMLCNVTIAQQFEGCFTKTIQKFGGLDIVINNAGMVNETDDGWKHVIDTNFVGVVTGTKLSMKHMSRSNGGRGGLVINVASLSALMIFPFIPVYSATKAAVNQLSRCYGNDFFFEDTGVMVICLNLGPTETSILEDANKHAISDKGRAITLPSFLKAASPQTPESVGNCLIEVMKKAQNGSCWTIANSIAELSVFKF